MPSSDIRRGGRFAIETKNRGGRVVADRGRLVDRWDARYARQAVHEAMWVRDRVAVRFVKALLVYPSVKVEPDVILLPRVTVLSLARLNAEITSQPASLSADEIRHDGLVGMIAVTIDHSGHLMGFDKPDLA